MGHEIPQPSGWLQFYQFWKSHIFYVNVRLIVFLVEQGEEVEAQMKRIEATKGVIGTLVVDPDGKQHQKAEQYCSEWCSVAFFHRGNKIFMDVIISWNGRKLIKVKDKNYGLRQLKTLFWCQKVTVGVFRRGTVLVL